MLDAASHSGTTPPPERDRNSLPNLTSNLTSRSLASRSTHAAHPQHAQSNPHHHAPPTTQHHPTNPTSGPPNDNASPAALQEPPSAVWCMRC